MVVLMIGVAGILGAMQVISTQAQSDPELLKELSTELAEAAAGESQVLPSTIVTSSGQSLQISPLTDQTAPFAASQLEADQTAETIQPLVTDPTPEATSQPTATATSTVVPAEGCAPALSGAPYCVYEVEEGDTLSEVAEQLGIESTVAFSGAELVALSNGLNDAQNWVIVPGQELRIPIQSGVIHTVSEIDSLSYLAEIYGVTTAEIVSVNRFNDPNHIPVGDEIIVPSPTLWPWNGPVAAVEELENAEDENDADTDEGESESDTKAQEQETPEETAEEVALAAAADEPEEREPEVDEAEETPEPTATRVPARSTPRATSPSQSNPSLGSTRDQFAAGYIAAGGPPQYLEHILAAVIPCESSFNVRAYNPAGPFYGLMQFLPQTWANTGGGDWFDAWQQGHNTGVLLKSSTPASQWPHCWRGG